MARSQTSTTIAIGSACTRLGSVAQGPVRIQNAPSSHRYQVGRTVGPLVATRAVRGWARKAAMSKGGGCGPPAHSPIPRDPPCPDLPVVIILHAGHACGAGRTWPALARLADLLRAMIEALHHLRDITFAKDDSQVHFLTSEQWVARCR